MRILFFLALFPLWLFAKDPELTRELDGVEITYTYSEGNTYNVQYTSKGVRYRYVSGEAPEDWWGPFPYKAFRTGDGQYFLGWYEKGFGDSITHLLDLKNKTLYGSGIIIKKKQTIEHFQSAKIESIRGWNPR